MIDQTQLQHMRERQLASLMDTCLHIVHSTSSNDYNEEIIAYVEGTEEIPCGIDMGAGNERLRTSDTVLQHDATARFTIEDGESFHVKDKIKLIKRFGETLDTPLEFEIVSPAQRGVSGIRFALRKLSL